MKTPGLHLRGLGSWPSLGQLLSPTWLLIIITPTSLGPEYVYFLWTSGYLSLPEPCLLLFPLWLNTYLPTSRSVPWMPCPPGSHFWFPRAVFFRLLQLLSFGQPSGARSSPQYASPARERKVPQTAHQHLSLQCRKCG